MRTVVGILLILSLYLLPSGIAVLKENENTTTVVLLNVLIGWTGIVWIICLIMALSGNKTRQTGRA